MENFNIWTSMLIPIACSLVVVLVSTRIERRRNDNELLAEYFNKLFQEIITDSLPKAVERIIFTDGVLSDTNFDELDEIIRDLIFKAKYFSYLTSDQFYDRMLKRCVDFEDYLINLTNQSINYGMQEHALAQIRDEHIKNILAVLKKEYLNNI